jgi:hypothetical protein
MHGFGKYARNYRHGNKPASGASPEYTAWNNMRSRCGNPKNSKYHDYGGRGIKVCERWLNSFENFLSDIGPKPASIGRSISLERADNDKGYEPGNVAWATVIKQANNRRSSRFIEHGGEIHTMAEWEALAGLKRGTLYARLKKGWSIERALGAVSGK